MPAIIISKLQEYYELLDALKEHNRELVSDDYENEFRRGQYIGYIEAISILNDLFEKELNEKL